MKIRNRMQTVKKKNGRDKRIVKHGRRKFEERIGHTQRNTEGNNEKRKKLWCIYIVHIDR